MSDSVATGTCALRSPGKILRTYTRLQHLVTCVPSPVPGVSQKWVTEVLAWPRVGALPLRRARWLEGARGGDLRDVLHLSRRRTLRRQPRRREQANRASDRRDTCVPSLRLRKRLPRRSGPSACGGQCGGSRKSPSGRSSQVTARLRVTLATLATCTELTCSCTRPRAPSRLLLSVIGVACRPPP